MSRRELWELKQMQSLPLEVKIQKTRLRIREWVDEFGEDGVYVSFSGGKDSTVLLDIARKDYPNIKAVFVNTGLEYPSVRLFAESKENVTVLRPIMNFRDVIIKYGYPVISKEIAQTIWEVQHSIKRGKTTPTHRMKKLNGEATDKDGNLSQYNIPQWKFLIEAPFNISHKCCDVMKKKPCEKYEKKHSCYGIIATMADESRLRKEKWLKNGCNAFDLKRPQSNPMSFWTEQDVLTYIHTYNLAIACAYGQVVVRNDGVDGQINIYDYLGDYRDCEYETTGCKRTGCIFCMFGITQDKDRFIRLAEQEPTLCDYVMRGGEFNKHGMWQPSKDGLGYWFVIEWLNIHGNLRIGIQNREKYIAKYQTDETMKYLKFQKGAND